jgi:hypothetical protein
MDAVVGQESIVTFAQARACPLHHLATIESSPVMPNPDLMAMREALERNLFHRSAPESVRKAGVMNDASVTNINAVMRVERSR